MDDRVAIGSRFDVRAEFLEQVGMGAFLEKINVVWGDAAGWRV
jgi:hypothetical protein